MLNEAVLPINGKYLYKVPMSGNGLGPGILSKDCTLLSAHFDFLSFASAHVATDLLIILNFALDLLLRRYILVYYSKKIQY